MTIQDLNESYILIKSDESSILEDLKKLLSAKKAGSEFDPRVRAGVWDGRINFFTKIDRMTIKVPKGLKSLVLSYCLKKEIDVDYEEDVYDNITKEDFDKFIDSLGLPFKPYDYQKKCAYDSITKGRLINVSATSSGKSLMIYLICRYMLETKRDVFIIVPNIMLVNQIYQDFVDYGFKDADKFVQRIGGEHKLKTIEKPICISTWQSQYRNAEGYDNIKCLIIDECQSVKGNESLLGNLIVPACFNAKFRFGFTGTLPKDLVERMSIQACLGRKNPVINAQGLINAGLATPLDIKCIYLNYNEEDTKTIQNFKDYHKEEKFIHEHHKRNLLVSKLINKISKKGNTLALYAKIIHGDLLLENLVRERSNIDSFYLIKKVTPSAIKEVNKDDIVFVRTKISDKDKKTIMSRELPLENFREIESLNIFCVDGSVPEKDREYIRQILESHENAVIFGTSQCMSTGVNIKKLHNLVFCQGGKSSITLAQSLGRLMRQHVSKEKSFVYDIIDSAKSKRGKENYLLKHFNERLAVYIEEGYPLEEKEINL